jgi:hypothetical protein
MTSSAQPATVNDPPQPSGALPPGTPPAGLPSNSDQTDPQPSRNPFRVLPAQRTPSPQSPSQAAAGAFGGAELPPDPLPSTAIRSSDADRPPATGSKLDKRVWVDILRGLIQQLGDLLHERLATLPADREAEIWRADDDDAAAIADPIANVVHRRVQVPGGADVADLLTAGAALAGYSLRNVRRMFSNRRDLKRRRQHGIAEAEPQDQP